jgi:hypothetical protein
MPTRYLRWLGETVVTSTCTPFLPSSIIGPHPAIPWSRPNDLAAGQAYLITSYSYGRRSTAHGERSRVMIIGPTRGHSLDVQVDTLVV